MPPRRPPPRRPPPRLRRRRRGRGRFSRAVRGGASPNQIRRSLVRQAHTNVRARHPARRGRPPARRRQKEYWDGYGGDPYQSYSGGYRPQKQPHYSGGSEYDKAMNLLGGSAKPRGDTGKAADVLMRSRETPVQADSGRAAPDLSKLDALLPAGDEWAKPTDPPRDVLYQADEAMEVAECGGCGQEVSVYASVCPYCGGEFDEEEEGDYEGGYEEEGDLSMTLDQVAEVYQDVKRAVLAGEANPDDLAPFMGSHELAVVLGLGNALVLDNEIRSTMMAGKTKWKG